MNHMLKSFDLEIWKQLPDDSIKNWQEHAPIGVSLAGFGQDFGLNKVFKAEPTRAMERWQLDEILDGMLEMQKAGTLFCTWNGASFDFRLMAIETGRFEDCSKLALAHCDLMLIAVWGKGWMVGLDKALRAHGLEGKRSAVKLNDGTEFKEMNGGHVPRLWQSGEVDACMEYFHRDLRAEYEIAHAVQKTKRLQFLNKAMTNTHTVHVEKLWTVGEILNGAMGEFPDTSWQDKPITPEQFVGWMKP